MIGRDLDLGTVVYVPGSGGGGGATGIRVGYVDQNTTSFPTRRPDGSSLQKEDYVSVSSTAIVPFTIGNITFNSKRDIAVWNGGQWVLSAGAVIETNEVFVAQKTKESISGKQTIQSAVNIELVNRVGKEDLDVEDYDNLTEALNYVWKELQRIGSITFKFTGFISQTQPVNNVKKGDKWYQSTVLPTTFPINVKTYDGTNWSSTTTEYSPTLLDLWSLAPDNNGYYWFNGWNKVDELVQPDDIILAFNNENELTLKTKTSNDINKTWILKNDGTWGLRNIKEWLFTSNLSSLESPNPNNYTLYILTQDMKSGDVVTHKKGLYRWDSTNQFTCLFTYDEVDEITIYRDDNDRLAFKPKTPQDEAKAWRVKNDGTWELKDIKEWKDVSTFTGITPDNHTLYLLTQDMLDGEGHVVNKRGLYKWDQTHNYTCLFTYDDVDNDTIYRNSTNKLAFKKKTAADENKVWRVNNLGEWILTHIKEYKVVDDFENEVFNNHTLYILTTNCTYQGDEYKKGLYVWNSVDGLILAFEGGGGDVFTDIKLNDPLPTTNINPTTIYRQQVYLYYHNGILLDQQPLGYKVLDESIIVTDTGITIDEEQGEIPWSDLDVLVVSELVDNERVAQSQFTDASFFNSDNKFDISTAFSRSLVYKLYHNPTKVAANYIEIDGFVDYTNQVINKPKIDNKEIIGDKTHEDYELVGDADFTNYHTNFVPKSKGIQFVFGPGTPSEPAAITNIDDSTQMKYANNRTSSNNHINTNFDDIYDALDKITQWDKVSTFEDIDPNEKTLYILTSDISFEGASYIRGFYIWIDLVGYVLISNEIFTDIDQDHNLPTNNIDSHTIYRKASYKYLHNGTDLNDEPVGYKILDDEYVSVSSTGITIDGVETIWAELTSTIVDELVTNAKIEISDFDTSDFFNYDSTLYDISTNFTREIAYSLYYNPTKTPDNYILIGEGEVDLTNYYTKDETDALLDEVDDELTKKLDKLTGTGTSVYSHTGSTQGEMNVKTAMSTTASDTNLLTEKGTQVYVDDKIRYLHTLVRYNNDNYEYPMGWMCVINDKKSMTFADVKEWLKTNDYTWLTNSYYWCGGCCGTTGVRNSADTGTAYIGRVTSGIFYNEFEKTVGSVTYSADTIYFKYDYNGTVQVLESRCKIYSKQI